MRPRKTCTGKPQPSVPTACVASARASAARAQCRQHLTQKAERVSRDSAGDNTATNGAPRTAAQAGSSAALTLRDSQPRAISDPFLTDADFATLPADWGLLLQFTTLLYYLQVMNPDNGLVRDKTEPNAPASIAAIGMALASSSVVVERGIVTREFAAKIARRQLRYLMELPQGPEPDASGYKGFFYHFLDIETGRRVWQCELSTIRFGIPFRRGSDSCYLFRSRHGRGSGSPPACQPAL